MEGLGSVVLGRLLAEEGGDCLRRPLASGGVVARLALGGDRALRRLVRLAEIHAAGIARGARRGRYRGAWLAFLAARARTRAGAGLAARLLRRLGLLLAATRLALAGLGVA